MPGVITIRTDPKACIVEIDGERLMNWQPWHFDHSYNNELNRAGVLRPDTIASQRGPYRICRWCADLSRHGSEAA
jgi:taurine dioxygenase